MKEFCAYWSVLLLFLFFFCTATYFLLFSSVWYVPLFLLTLFWVVEVLVIAVIFTNIFIVEGSKLSKRLFFSGFLFLAIGTAAIFRMRGKVEDSGFYVIISLFSFCASLLSMFFGSIIKNKKDGKKIDYEI